MSNRIRNMATASPAELLLRALSAGPGGGDIEAMEAQGQQQLAASDVLPTECSADCKAALEAAGVVFGGLVKGDPLFCNVTLPEGWKRVPTEHSMWTDLVDADGKVRANIFYKAAYYDRSAHMGLAR